MGRAPSLVERDLIALVQRGQWSIDSQGRIWRTVVNRGGHMLPCKPRRVEKPLPSGYLMVRAMIGGKRLCGLAHRLVWQHFKGDIPPGEEINHDNGLKDDNRPKNLLCGSSGENAEHAQRHGLLDQHGEQNPAAKLTDNQVAQIRLAYSKGGYTQAQLAERFGVNHQHISRLVRGQRRPKQGGPTADHDLRHSVCDRDPITQRFVGKKVAGRMLDGREWSEFPA